MITLQITPKTGVMKELIPSPRSLFDYLTSAIANKSITDQFVDQSPSYYIPENVEKNGVYFYLNNETSCYVQYPVNLNEDDFYYFQDKLKKVETGLDGFPVSVSIVSKSPYRFNYLPTLSNGGEYKIENHKGEKVSYTFVPNVFTYIPVVETPGEIRTIVFSFSPEERINRREGLTWTDALHRRLVKELPTSTKFTGSEFHNSGVIEDKGCWYLFDFNENYSYITTLRIVSSEPFTEEEIAAAKRIESIYIKNGMSVPVSVTRLSEEYAKHHTHFTSITPAILYTASNRNHYGRDGRGQIINTLLFSLFGDVDYRLQKLTHEYFEIEDGENVEGSWMKTTLPGFGWIRCRICGVKKNVLNVRGSHQSPYDIGLYYELETEKPVQLLGLGWSRKFGSGRCMGVSEYKQLSLL